MIVVLVSSFGSCIFFANALRLDRMFGREEGNSYGVIVDCGSSGTRAHIYMWDSSLSHAELLHRIEPVRDAQNKPVSLKITPGLSSLRDDPESSSRYMQPIINFILRTVGEQMTGVYVLGTAGMRLLDSAARLSIVKDVSKDLKDNHNFAKVDTSVISGSDEGVYEWISVNAKAKRLNNSATYAIVEMGGASIQVTYQLKRDIYERVSNDLQDVRQDALYVFRSSIVEPQISRDAEEQNIKLVSLTWLGFGSNSAREAYVDLLIRDYIRRTSTPPLELAQTIESLGIVDPCIPLGGTDTVVRPTKVLLGAQRQTVGLVLEDDDEPNFQVNLVGSGNYEKCRRSVRRMLFRAKNEKLNCKQLEPCAMSLIGTPFVPHDALQFLGLGDLYHTTKLLNSSGTYDRDRVIDKTKEMCNSDLVKLRLLYPDVKKDKKSIERLLEGCFKAVWIDVFLTDGLMMPHDSKNLETVNQINGEEIDWTLGAIMDKALAIEEASDRRRQSIWGRVPKLLRKNFIRTSPKSRKSLGKRLRSDRH